MAEIYTVEVLPVALRDMTSVTSYVAKELCNPSAAEHLAGKLADAIKSLEHMPFRCPLHIPLRPLDHEFRKLHVGKHAVFFWVNEADKRVTVARVLYARMDVSRHLSAHHR